MEPSLATGGSETTRLVSARDRSSAGGGLRLKRDSGSFGLCGLPLDSHWHPPVPGLPPPAS
uniref:Solute carrier family 30 (zinc transporter), member 3 n=1 Tax=Mus musculus TaxID=10090 RepID=S4R1P0_MOUSE